MNDRRDVHPSIEPLARYVRGGLDLTAGAEWAIESHLENCPGCRARLAELTTEHTPEVAVLVANAWEALTPAITTSRPSATRRARTWLSTWISPVMIPWLVGAVLIAAAAIALGRPAGGATTDSVLFLLAPLVPVSGVAAAWSSRLDPMYELTIATARAGLNLLLRRTAAALMLVLPLLLAASGVVGTSPVLWLLPSLVCTLAALAVGSLIGVERAALGVAGLWLVTFTPGVVLDERPPELLGKWTPAMWAVIGALALVVLRQRAEAFLRCPRASEVR